MFVAMLSQGASGMKIVLDRCPVIIKCETPPVIDGVLNDDCWREPLGMTGFILLDTARRASEQTTVYVTYDDENVYFAFKCDEPNPDSIAANETKHDQQVVDDDCIELFLDLNRDCKNYFHFIVNSKGVTSDGSVELVDDFIDIYYDWEPEYEVKTSVDDKHWYVEMAIPFESLQTGIERPSVFKERKEVERSAYSLLTAPVVEHGTAWNFCFARRKQTEQKELSSFPGVCDKFYMPYQFDHILFWEKPIEKYTWDRPGTYVGMDNDVYSAYSDIRREHNRIVNEKKSSERDRLQPIIDEISSYILECNWEAKYSRGLFMGYESADGEIRIPNYARRDGQGRIVLDDAYPPLDKKALNKIISKQTPRFVYDDKSLGELREKISNNPNILKQWLKIKEDANAMLDKPMVDFVSNEMQQDRNCISRDQAKRAAEGYGALGSTRMKCALVYAITGETKYAKKAWGAQSKLIDHYEKYQVFRSAENWYSIWDSSYEMFSSTYAYDMLADSGVMSNSDKARLIEFIRQMGHSVDYCVKYSEMVGNHQFMWTGNFGCMVAYFPEFPEHERWANDVESRMPMLYADILNDGGQIERSPGHHIYGLSFLCKYANAVKHLTGENLFIKEYDGKSLEMTLDWMAKIATPLGETPALNDSKRPQMATHLFMLDVINQFDKGEYLEAGKIDTTGLPLEHLVSDSIKPKTPNFKSLLLPDTGWAVMRDSWDKDSKYLIFDYGEHGAWHGHYDKMNFVMYADGIGWVLDAGASPHYCVYIKEHNEWHKQTIAHNTVFIDNKSQDAVTGTLRKWESRENFDLVSASHDGYEGIDHTRTIYHPRDEYFIINDYLKSSDSQKHDYSWLLHVYGEPGKVDKSLVTFTKDGKSLLVIPADSDAISSVDLKKGLCLDTTSERKTKLRDDGTWTPGDPGWGYIPYIGLNKSTDADEVNYIVLLYPHDSEIAPEIKCEKLIGKNNNAYGIKITHDDFVDIYGEKKPGVATSREIELGDIQTSADYFFVRIKDGEVVEAEVIDGGYLFYKGIAVYTGTNPSPPFYSPKTE